MRARCGLLVVLVRRGRDRALHCSEGCELHRGDGVPVRLHEPGHRARHHHVDPARLAIHGRRIRRRTAHDRDSRRALPHLPHASARRRRTQPGRARPQGLDGRPRPNGHVGHRRETVGADLLGARVHRDLALLPDGLGVDLEGRRRRTRPCRRARVVGAEGMVAGVLRHARSDARRDLGAVSWAPGFRRQLRVLDWQRPARGGALERRHQLRRRGCVHLRRPHRHPDPQHLPQVLRRARQPLSLRDVLRGDGPRGLRGRGVLRRTRAHPDDPRGAGRRARDHIQLHDSLERAPAWAGHRSCLAGRQDRRIRYGPHDGRHADDARSARRLVGLGRRLERSEALMDRDGHAKNERDTTRTLLTVAAVAVLALFAVPAVGMLIMWGVLATTRAVIFDLGGTLVHWSDWDNSAELKWAASYDHLVTQFADRKWPSRDGYVMAMRESEREHWRRVDTEHWSGPPTGLVREGFDRLGVPVSEAELLAAMDGYAKAIAGWSTVDPDGATTVKLLRDRGYRIGLLSNTWWAADWHNADLVMHGLAALIDVIVYTSDLAHS